MVGLSGAIVVFFGTREGCGLDEVWVAVEPPFDPGPGAPPPVAPSLELPEMTKVVDWGKPVVVPVVVPFTVPVAVPFTVPVAVPFTVPVAVPFTVPVAVPFTVPVAVPFTVPVAVPFTVPVAVPVAPVEVTAGSVLLLLGIPPVVKVKLSPVEVPVGRMFQL